MKNAQFPTRNSLEVNLNDPVLTESHAIPPVLSTASTLLFGNKT